MRIFLHTLRVLSPTPAGRVPVSSHPSGVQPRRFAAGPCLSNINNINRLRRSAGCRTSARRPTRDRPKRPLPEGYALRCQGCICRRTRVQPSCI